MFPSFHYNTTFLSITQIIALERLSRRNEFSEDWCFKSSSFLISTYRQKGTVPRFLSMLVKQQKSTIYEMDMVYPFITVCYCI